MDIYDDEKEEDQLDLRSSSVRSEDDQPFDEQQYEDGPEVDQEEVDNWGRRLDTYLYCLNNNTTLSAGEKCERLDVLNHFMFEWDHRFKQIGLCPISDPPTEDQPEDDQRGRVESLWNVFIVDFIDLMEMIQV
jgi:hypothetical protein